MKRIALVLLLGTFLRFFSSFSVSASGYFMNNSSLERKNGFSEKNLKNKNNISNSMVSGSERQDKTNKLQTANSSDKTVNSNFKTESKNLNKKKVATAKINIKPNQRKDSNFAVNPKTEKYDSFAAIYGKNDSKKTQMYKILRSTYEKLGSNFFVGANVSFFSNIFASLIKDTISSTNKKAPKSSVFVLEKTTETKENKDFDLSNETPVKIEEITTNYNKIENSFYEEKKTENRIPEKSSEQNPAGKEKEDLEQKAEDIDAKNCLEKETESFEQQYNNLENKRENNYIFAKFIFAAILLLVIIYIVSKNYKKDDTKKIVLNKNIIDDENLKINQIHDANFLNTPENNKNRNFKISDANEITMYGKESKKKQDNLEIQNIDLNVFGNNIEKDNILLNRRFNNLSMNPQISNFYVKAILKGVSPSKLVVSNSCFCFIPNKDIKNVICEIDNTNNFSFLPAPKKREIKLTVKRSVKKETFTYKRFGNAQVSKTFNFSVLPSAI